MKLPILLAALILPALSLGCQPRGEYEALQRELFQKESRIYELQSDIDQYRRVLDSCRRANLALEADIAGTSDNQGLRGPGTPSRDSTPAPGRRPTPFLPIPEIPDVELPPEAESLPEIELPPGLEESNPSGPPPLFEGARYSQPNPAVQQAVAASTEVQSIGLNKLLTGGYNMDGHPGDEGILVVIEPRDGQGEIIAAAGEVSIVLLDEQAAGDQKRFARWDFEPHEVQARWRESPLGHGLHFELPWPADPPTHKQMHIFARLVTADSRKLAADKPIKIDLLDGAIAVGLQRSIDRGILHLTQPAQAQPLQKDAPPHLQSVLVGAAEPIAATPPVVNEPANML
ncbi:MAG: hypothetical protein WD030_10110, partial [Pirellulales bacterium]